MNKRDSEILSGLLVSSGYQIIENWEDADIILLNTCAVRQHAEDKAISILGSYAHEAKKRLKDRKVFGIIGCVAEEMKEKLFKRCKYLDIVCGPNNLAELPEKMELALEGKRVCITGGNARLDDFYNGSYFSGDGKHSFIIIMEGCDNFCSYCIVPYTRGRERSRKSADITNEIKSLIERGKEEFTLLGQNVNSYKSDIGFVELLDKVSEINGVKKLSFVTSHPKDVSDEMFYLMEERENIVRYLHLPFQSGSDRILKLMKRGYTREHYIKIAEKYKKIVTGGHLSTDIIVGFPTETEKDFEDTLSLLKSLAFNSAYIFKYSPRPPATAASMKDDVPKEEKERRHRILLDCVTRVK